MKRIGYSVLVILLSSVAWLHLVGRIDLTTADLGRHIRNGELALVQHHIVATNYYSYTYPDFPTICHHWGIGIIFYLIWKAWGFLGLSVFYGAVLWMTWALFTGIAAATSSLRAAFLAAAVALPLLAYRIEIRPEGLTTLFLGINFLLLELYRLRRIRGRWLWLIPAVQLAWVNVHILFVIGLGLIAIFAAEAFLAEGLGRRFKLLAAVGAASVVLSCVNPFGLEGVLQPFNIFKSYAYALAENQTVFFMMKRFPGDTVYRHFFILWGVAMALFVLRVAGERDWRKAFLHFALLLVFGGMAFKMVRSIAMFGFIFIPLVAENGERVIALYAGRWSAMVRRGVAVVTAGVIVAAAVVPYFYLSPLKAYSPLIADSRYKNALFYVLSHSELWGGLAPGVEGSAEFFKANRLQGPVFNNYDIGGYFILHLFPGERPFVDNRPEAYPAEFFEKVYGPMQEDDQVWEEAGQRYGFQLIYFFRHDMTTWAQPFLLRRLEDPRWAPVFVDAWTIILARRGGLNQSVIDRFELPKEMFRMRKD